jgi:hypothetical protein
MRRTVRLNIGERHKVLLGSENLKSTVDVLFFTNHVVRTKAPSLITHADFIANIKIEELKEKVGGVDKIFILYESSSPEYGAKLAVKNVQATGSKAKIILVPTYKFGNNYDKLYAVGSRVYSQLIKIPIFQVAQIPEYLSKAGDEQQLDKIKTEISKIEDDLRAHNKAGTQSNIQKTVLSAKKLPYIKSFSKSDDLLVVHTKNVFMDFVPNVGGHISPATMRNNNAYYEIFKAQLLGMNFITPGAEYSVPYDMNIISKGCLNESFKEFLGRLYFGASHPHIGVRGKCYGEFISGVSAAQKHGLDFLLASFEVFLRSANMMDSAGATVIRLPMGTRDGKITMWPAIDDYVKKAKIKVPYRAGVKTEEYYTRVSRIVGYVHESLNVYQSRYDESWFNENLALLKSREKPNVVAKIEQNILEGKCFIL